MHRNLLLALALLAALPLAAQETADQDGRYLIQFRQFGGAAAAVRAAGGTPVVELTPQAAVAAYLPAQALAGLRRNPNVVLIEPDARRYPLAQTMPYGIGMVQADQVSDAAAGNTTVCVIDSGYYRAHEDLAKGSNYGGPVGSGTVTGSSGVGTGNWYEDSCGHGTHVAGTISALSNTLGVKGVLGSGAINIRAEKVFDGAACGWSYSSTLVAALNACRSNAATPPRLVVSMSLGGSFSSSVESAAFQAAYDAGVLSVAAAGNDGNKRKSYPASYPSVISVAAVDSNKAIASFSQQNSEVELAAPGVGVLSTVPFISSSVTVGGTTYLGENIDGSTRTNVTAPLLDGGLCSSAGAWGGAVVLCQRGDISFAAKVANVVSGGGKAAVIYNNVAGGFAGTLNGSSTIPAISISQEDGTVLLGKLGQSATVNNAGGTGSGYATYDGTSMATPHVSGVAALVWSNQPTKTNVQLRASLQASAEDLGPAGRDNAYGYGLVRAKAALDHLAGGTPPPTNNPPTASFTYNCSGLSCDFTDTSTDADGNVASWNWNFGDTNGSSARHPSHAYAAAGTYTVALTVTDDGAATGTTTQSVTVVAAPPPGGIVLTATGSKVKGVNTVDLRWTGASTGLDIYRHNVKVQTSTPNDSQQTDSTGAKGPALYTYKLCPTGGTTNCSNEVQVVF
ncbi:MAG: S8 family serine peptidase [Rhizobacter sp.]|nr:S8 family serine peptidase [Rhizobacter sp.]